MQKETIERIKRERQNLQESLTHDGDELTFFNEFLQTYDFLNPLHYDEIDIKSFLIAYVRSNSNKFTIEELTNVADYLSPILNKLSSQELESIFLAIDDFTDSNAYPGILSMATKEKSSRAADFMDLVTCNDSADEECKIPYLDQAISIMLANEELFSFIQVFHEDKNAWGFALALTKAFKKISERKKALQALGYPLHKAPSLVSRPEIPSIEEKLIDEFEIEEIVELLKPLNKHQQRLKRKEKNRKKEGQKKLKDYDKIIAELENPPKEITDYRLIAATISSTPLRLQTLQEIYRHNHQYYQQIEKEYQDTMNNSTLGFQSLCNQYQLSKIDIEEIRGKYSYQQLETVLKDLTKVGITNSLLNQILLTSSFQTIEDLLSYNNRGLISLDVLRKNPDLWKESQKTPEMIERNLQTIQEITGNKDWTNKKDQILFLPPENLRRNLQTLKNYSLLPSLPTTTNYRFLSQDNLEDKIDLILELGKEREIENNLDLLNYDKPRWMRLRILEQLNIPVAEAELEALLHTNSFFVPDEKVEEYISEEPFPEELEITKEALQETLRTFIYRGIPFSKEKAKRSFFQLETLVEIPTLTEALCLNRKFTSQELNNIKTPKTSNKV